MQDHALETLVVRITKKMFLNIQATSSSVMMIVIVVSTCVQTKHASVIMIFYRFRVILDNSTAKKIDYKSF